jgi:hypothetical protein
VKTVNFVNQAITALPVRACDALLCWAVLVLASHARALHARTEKASHSVVRVEVDVCRERARKFVALVLYHDGVRRWCCQFNKNLCRQVLSAARRFAGCVSQVRWRPITHGSLLLIKHHQTYRNVHQRRRTHQRRVRAAAAVAADRRRAARRWRRGWGCKRRRRHRGEQRAKRRRRRVAVHGVVVAFVAHAAATASVYRALEKRRRNRRCACRHTVGRQRAARARFGRQHDRRAELEAVGVASSSAAYHATDD